MWRFLRLFLPLHRAAEVAEFGVYPDDGADGGPGCAEDFGGDQNDWIGDMILPTRTGCGDVEYCLKISTMTSIEAYGAVSIQATCEAGGNVWIVEDGGFSLCVDDEVMSCSMWSS